MSIRMQISPEDFKRAKLVKPGWFPTLIKAIVQEPNQKRDAMNVVLDLENADRESEYMGVPVKHWLSEKAVHMPGGAVSFIKAWDPTVDETVMQDFEYEPCIGKYIYAKWEQSRGKAGDEPPRNVIVDWAPLPKKLRHLNEQSESVAVEGFEKV